MGVKDKAEKILEDFKDVFADICNVLLFKSPFLQEEQLENGSTESIYKAEEGELADQIRDKIMHYRDQVYIMASIGIENQSTVEKYMPIRVMGYDYASYRGQLDRKEPLSPVITIVLNFSEERWTKPKNLHGLLSMPPQLKAFVQDYGINVFDVSYLDDEVIEQFTSDFKVVARFFKEKRLHPGTCVIDDTTEIKHVEAVMDLLRVFTGDSKYAELYHEVLKNKIKKGEAITMCSIADAYINKGMQEGMREGKFLTIFELVQEGDISLQKASAKLELSEDDVIARMTEAGYKLPALCCQESERSCRGQVL